MGNCFCKKKKVALCSCGRVLNNKTESIKHGICFLCYCSDFLNIKYKFKIEK